MQGRLWWVPACLLGSHPSASQVPAGAKRKPPSSRWVLNCMINSQHRVSAAHRLRAGHGVSGGSDAGSTGRRHTCAHAVEEGGRCKQGRTCRLNRARVREGVCLLNT